MAKVRVYELAKEFGVESKAVMARLQEMGEFVRSASSTIEAPVVRKLKEEFGAKQAQSAKGRAPQRAEAAPAAPAGTNGRAPAQAPAPAAPPEPSPVAEAPAPAPAAPDTSPAAPPASPSPAIPPVPPAFGPGQQAADRHERFFHPVLHPLNQRRHGDQARHAQDDAQHGQRRAEFVRPDPLKPTPMAFHKFMVRLQ